MGCYLCVAVWGLWLIFTSRSVVVSSPVGMMCVCVCAGVWLDDCRERCLDWCGSLMARCYLFTDWTMRLLDLQKICLSILLSICLSFKQVFVKPLFRICLNKKSNKTLVEFLYNCLFTLLMLFYIFKFVLQFYFLFATSIQIHKIDFKRHSKFNSDEALEMMSFYIHSLTLVTYFWI